jgi:hypothetical protein
VTERGGEGLKRMGIVRESRWDSVGYLLLLGPAIVACWCGLTFTPMLRKAFQEQLDGAALPHLTQVLLNATPHLLAIPVIIFFLGVASFRFRFLNHPIVVGFVGSVLASFYLVYGFSMALPIITITISLGEARSGFN